MSIMLGLVAEGIEILFYSKDNFKPNCNMD